MLNETFQSSFTLIELSVSAILLQNIEGVKSYLTFCGFCFFLAHPVNMKKMKMLCKILYLKMANSGQKQNSMRSDTVPPLILVPASRYIYFLYQVSLDLVQFLPTIYDFIDFSNGLNSKAMFSNSSMKVR